MLKFFKKSVRKEQSLSPPSTPTSPVSCTNLTPDDFKYGTKESQKFTASPQKGPLASFEDEGLDLDDLTRKECSRLSKTLLEVLNDKAALGYFVQFLETRNALPYVRCWLDIENFQSAVKQFEVPKEVSVSSSSTKLDHDSLSVSTDCDSLPGDTTSFSGEQTICDNNKNETSLNNNNNDGVIQEFTDDALRIFKKYIAIEATESVNISEDIRRETIENICRLSAESFKAAQTFVFNVLDTEYFSAFLGSDYYCKHQIDVLTSGNVVLEDILYNETALFYFMEFLEQENNRVLLDFWLAANNFHQQLNDQKEFLDPVEAQNDAVILYDKYFSLQALCPLGFSDKIRFAVEQSICGENGLIQDCFHLPLKIIEKVLNEQYLKNFLASQLFYKYLSELINTVQSNGYGLYDKRCIPSECSSEKSFSTNSTFLALEMRNNRNTNNKNKTADMNIDSRQLYDPDSLWKRKRHHRLSIGRVTELGKFVPDMEPEFDRRNESRIKNVVRKFVSLDDDKKKEELAWQVAEMIVKDITSVTLSEQNT